MYKITSYILLFFAFYSASLAQERIHMAVDFTRFKGIPSEINVELYYSMYPHEWHHVRTASGTYEGSVKTEILIYKEKTLIYHKTWKMMSKLDSSQTDQAIVDLLRFSFPPGNYEAILYAEDIYSTAKTDSMSIYVQLNEFHKEKLCMSDIELCQSIVEESKPDLFTKNHLRVIPNPQKTYGGVNSNLFYYFEIYNILEHIKNNKFTIELYVSDIDGNKIESVRTVKKKKTKKFDSSVEVGAINISSLPSGSYGLICNIKSSGDKDILQNNQTFYVYNPQVAVHQDKN